MKVFMIVSFLFSGTSRIWVIVFAYLFGAGLPGYMGSRCKDIIWEDR